MIASMRISKGPEEFIPLDNAALIYPPTIARFNSNVFRLSFDVDIAVIPERLLKALNNIMVRFPYYKVSLHNGFFWYYLTQHEKPLEVYPDRSYPCAYFNRHRSANGYLFKVMYREDRIAVEYFHALTDGTGGLIFLKSLVAEYLRLSGIEVGDDPQVFKINTPINEEESADSFQKFFFPIKSVMESDVRAFHVTALSADLTDRTNAITAMVSVSDMKLIASEFQATITEYLTAELLDAYQRIQQQRVSSSKRYKPIRISVPVNIRRVFDSKSMRNFTLFVVVGIDPRLGAYSFTEIIEQVKYQLRNGVNTKSLSRQISRNVAGGRNVLVRYAPNFLKRPFMKILSDRYGDRLYSSVISNLGNVSLPSGMAEHVTQGNFFLSPSKALKISMGVMGIHSSLSINISSNLKTDTVVEREFLTALVNRGIAVEIASNRTDSMVAR